MGLDPTRVPRTKNQIPTRYPSWRQVKTVEDDNMIYDHRYVLRTHPIAREQWAIHLSHGSVSALEWGPTLTAHLKFDPPLAPLQSQKLLSAKLPKKWCRVSTSQWGRKKNPAALIKLRENQSVQFAGTLIILVQRNHG